MNTFEARAAREFFQPSTKSKHYPPPTNHLEAGAARHTIPPGNFDNGVS